MFSPGEKLESGHYMIVKEVGQGGMGIVYHCHDELLQRDVAAKILLPEVTANKNTVEMFIQEARLAAQLDHPNIVTIYDIGKEERQGRVHHFMVMEYLTGGNLGMRLSNSALSVELFLNWMKQLATGLSFAHKRGIVHQDIKADNIFITTEGDLKIGDFGLARLGAGRVKHRTTHGMGTPAYMSPELCRGEPQDHRSDIYSMGVLFYEMATGQLPFKARGMIEMAMKHASAPIPSARKTNPAVPPMLDKVIQKMMAKTPAERYQSMADVLAILDDLIFELRVARLGLDSRGEGGARGGEPRSAAGGSTSEQTRFDPRNVDLMRLSGDRAAGAAASRESQPPVSRPAPKEVFDITSSLNEGPESPIAQEVAQAAAAAEAFLASPAVSDELTGRSQLPTGEPTGKAVAAPAGRPAVPHITSVPITDLELAWQFQTHGPIGWKSMPVPNKEETVIYLGSSDGVVYALEDAVGSKIWSYETGGPILASPLVLPGKVLVASTDGILTCLAAVDGQPLWKYQGTSAFVSTPSLSQDTVFAGTMEGRLLAIDAQRGTLKWQFKANDAIVASAHTQSNVVLFGAKDGCLYALSSNSGQLKWKFQTRGPLVGGPVASVDSIYVGSVEGTFYALDADSGRVIWEYQTDRPIVARAAIAFTAVMFCSQDKWLYCCEKYDGRLLWKAPVRGRVVANLVISAGSVYAVTCEGLIQAFVTGTGKARWQMDLKKRLESSPLITSRMLYIATVDGDLRAYTISEQALARPA